MSRQILIAGADCTEYIPPDSFSIEQVLTQSVDTCSFRITNIKPIEGQEVIVYNGATKLFAGIIDQVNLVDTDLDTTIMYDCTCQDYTYQLNRKLVVETYQNMSADAIAKDIIAKYGGGIFTTNHIQSGAPIVEEIIFDYEQPSDCLKDLADYVGWDWYVDYNRDVWFFNPAEFNQPAPITLKTGGPFRNFKHNIDTQSLRNRVYVRGGTMLSDPWTYSISADGVARTWVLPHKPHNINVTVGGVTKTCGIENVDDESKFDFLMNFEEKYVKCSSQTPTPAAGTTLSFTYQYDIDVITMVEDVASQQAIAAIQGGDGVYEYVINDDSLTTIDAAEAAGNADLRQYSNPQVKGSFETEVDGWAPGQLLSINLPTRGVQGTFLVQKVTITPCSHEKWTYKVEYGGRLLGISDWLTALYKAQQKKQTNDTALLHKFRYEAETIKTTDEVQGTLRTPSWKVEQGLESLLDITMPGDPTFTRSSNAYKSDGTQVTVNTPRFEQGQFGQAIMIEEGTTNLVQNSNGEQGDGWWLVDNANRFHWNSTLAAFENQPAAPTYSYRTKSPNISVTPGVSYTYSLYMKGNAWAMSVRFYDANNTQLLLQTLYLYPFDNQQNDYFRRFSLTVTAPANASYAVLYFDTYQRYNLLRYIQFEAKPYATTYINGTRSAETLTIPTAGVLNENNFDISGWFIPTINSNVASQYAHICVFYNVPLTGLYNDGGFIKWAWNDTSVINTGITLNAGDVLFYSISKTNSNVTVRVAKNGGAILTFTGATDGTTTGTTAIVLGSAGSSNFFNGKHDDLRISNRARTDTEIAADYNSGLPSPVDEWTTYKLNFDGDLSRLGFGQQYATAGGLAMVQQLDSNPWPQLQYATSTDGSTWSAWSDVDNKVIDVPYPGYLKVRGAARLPVKVGVRNWKKPFDQTDVVCGFIMVTS